MLKKIVMKNYSRYKSFENNGKCKIVPFIEIPKSPNDIYVHYTDTRLDILSYEYYGDANYGWLILQANPHVATLEFNIPKNSVLRIPFPLSSALNAYEMGAKQNNNETNF